MMLMALLSCYHMVHRWRHPQGFFRDDDTMDNAKSITDPKPLPLGRLVYIAACDRHTCDLLPTMWVADDQGSA
jgi:hypothetical protein